MELIETFGSAKAMWQWVLHHCRMSDITKIAIRSYGMYIGVDHDGVCQFSAGTTAIIELVKEVKDVKILCGTGDIGTTVYECHHKKAEVMKQLFPHVRIRMSPCDHTKCVLLQDGTAIIGGANLTLSTWSDYSFAVRGDDIFTQLEDDFNEMWANKADFELPLINTV
jgi:hypothetical protein